MDQQQLTAWVSAARAGDIDSFGRLCECCCNSITALAYSILADHQLAEDAAQETFARALKSLGQLKTSDKFFPWLAQICRNTATDMARTKARYVSAKHPEQLEDEPIPSRDHQLVRQALQSLSESDRELIVLRYYNALSQKEMASVLQLTPAAVNNRLLRAKQKIAAFLQQHPDSEVER